MTNLTYKTFQYDNHDILIIMDSNRKLWFKSSNLCKILLHDPSSKNIKSLVSSRYRKTWRRLNPHIRTSLKIKSNSIFVTNTGMYKMAIKSTKPNAIEFWKYMTDHIIPEFFKKGGNPLPIKKIPSSDKKFSSIQKELSKTKHFNSLLILENQHLRELNNQLHELNNQLREMNNLLKLGVNCAFS